MNKFELHGSLEFDGENWWIQPIIGNSNLAVGTADLYKLPSDLVEKMQLNTLLNSDSTSSKLGKIKKVLNKLT